MSHDCEMPTSEMARGHVKANSIRDVIMGQPRKIQLLPSTIFLYQEKWGKCTKKNIEVTT